MNATTTYPVVRDGDAQHNYALRLLKDSGRRHSSTLSDEVLRQAADLFQGGADARTTNNPVEAALCRGRLALLRYDMASLGLAMALSGDVVHSLSRADARVIGQTLAREVAREIHRQLRKLGDPEAEFNHLVTVLIPITKFVERAPLVHRAEALAGDDPRKLSELRLAMLGRWAVRWNTIHR